MKQLIGALLLVIWSSAWAAAPEPKDANYAWQQIKSGAIILDVRTPEEFAQSHLQGAVNVPYEQVAQWAQQQNLSKDTDIVLYCRSGNRSGKATTALTELGYNNAYNGGGLTQLQNNKPED
ncbi:rhodanese-like domain-containing protein [Paraferrimonas haliotis]|uniref:Sulfurtransferase n=1 Tax=Paraferrimonas haliotis TaxID=2013866 RepID=A0AA37TVJ5_9GAMM|nr:rhodanese-like domain-containing protein [Paraferrimonas haliotis]GLS82631.1 sulfurtransferase [Paraferrimonas haliotis]